MKYPYLIILISAFFLSLTLDAQTPQQINYQAVARDVSGNPMINATLSLVFEIRQGSATGAVVYSETQTATTNNFGLFTVAVGAGTLTFGTFSTINWGFSSFYLQVTVNNNIMQATQLLSVPYALYANSSANGPPGLPGNNGLNCWDTNGNGINDTAEDINGDGVWNTLDCKGDTGLTGANGLGINWLGSLVTPPAGNTNDAYYNSTNGISYIFNGTTLVWDTLSSTDNDWTIAGANMSSGITGNVGIGTTSPTTKLDVVGKITTDSLRVNVGAGTFGNVLTDDGTGNASWQPLPTSTSPWTKSFNTIYPSMITDKVGIGTSSPSQQLSVVSADSMIATFTSTSANFSAIAITNTTNADMGILMLSTFGDTAIFGYTPAKKMVVVDNSTIGGHIALNADSSVTSYAKVVATSATGKIFNQTPAIYNQVDTILNYSINSTAIINVNKGKFLTDSLYVFGNNSGMPNWVLANNGSGKAKWTDPSLIGGSSLWQSSTPNIFFNTGNVGIGTSFPNAPLDISYTGSLEQAININYTSSKTLGSESGIYVNANCTGGANVFGGYFRVFNSSSSTISSAINAFNIATSSLNYGVEASATGTTTGINYGIYSSASNATTNWAGYFDQGNVYIGSSLFLPTGSGAGKILTSDAAGKATWKPHQVAFEASLSATLNLTAIPIVFDATTLNDGGNYNTTSGLFTAPVAGVYSFQVTLTINNTVVGAATRDVLFQLIDASGGTALQDVAQTIALSTINMVSFNSTIKLTVGQQIFIQGEATGVGTSPQILGGNQSWFSGHLVYAY